MQNRAHVFESDRLTMMREMIFSKSAEDRRLVLERLLPMQRKDFIELFEIMKDLPVCIRLFDPPLHEFLPSNREACMIWQKLWVYRYQTS